MPQVGDLRGRIRRMIALIRKETLQMKRDPSSIAIGVLLPVMLVLIFGYGLSQDPHDIPIGVVIEGPDPVSVDFTKGFYQSPYFVPVTLVAMPDALKLMNEQKLDAIVRVRPNFSREISLGQGKVELIVNGADANYARLVKAYVEGAIAHWGQSREAEGYAPSYGPVLLESRLWFNEANDSRYYLVPGLIVLVMTLIGAFLTALVMAREWERGTLESLFVTPVRVNEILIGKTVPYFLLGMVGLTLCLVSAKWLFNVPFRGSFILLMGVSMVYLLVCLGAGLLISSAVKNQFVASQIAVLSTFLPAFMLSGFLFDIRSMSPVLQTITQLLPARYYVELIQTLFLAGNVPTLVLYDTGILALMAIFFLGQSIRITRKRLD